MSLFISVSDMRSEVLQLMSKFEIEIPLDVPVKELSPGQLTLLTVLKVLLRKT